MRVPIKGLSPDIHLTTDNGVVEVRNLAYAIEVGVKTNTRIPYKVKNTHGEWVAITGVTNLGLQEVRDFILDDGRCFVLGRDQEVLTNKGFLSGSSIKVDREITLHNEGEVLYPPVELIQGFPSLPMNTNSLSTLKLLGMLTAFGRVIPELGIIGIVDVQPRMTVEFISLMESVFHIAPEDIVKTKQSSSNMSVHYEHIGLSRWLNGLLSNGIPYEVMRASREQILMFLRGMYDQRYNQVQTPIKGAKYVYHGSSVVVARQVFSLLRVLGYTPRVIHKQGVGYSVLTIGVNIHEDTKLRTDLYKDKEILDIRIKEAYNYSDQLYLVEIEQGDNFIADGLVIKAGV